MKKTFFEVAKSFLMNHIFHFFQVWPIPCVIGALVGYIIGLAISTLTFAFSEGRLRP